MKERFFYSIWDKLDFKDKINKDLFIVDSVNYNFKKIFIHKFKYFNNTFFLKIVKQLNAIIVNIVILLIIEITSILTIYLKYL